MGPVVEEDKCKKQAGLLWASKIGTMMTSTSNEENNGSERITTETSTTFEGNSSGTLTRAWSQDDNAASLLKSPDGQEISGPKFQPGDHVIRWKLLKFMVWPIQIHGIVLSVETESEENQEGEGGTNNDTSSFQQDSSPRRYKVTIADFGYTSSQQQQSMENNNKKGENKNILQKINKMNQNMNDMMKSFYKTKQTDIGPDSAVDMDDTYFDRIPSTSPTNSPLNDQVEQKNANISSEESKMNSQQDQHFKFDGDENDPEKRQRFQVIQISDPEDLKKWHKIDYGKSLFKKGSKLKEKMAQSGRNLAQSGRNLMGKLKLDKLKLDKLKLDKLNFRKKSSNYSTIAMDQDDTNITSESTSISDNTPKLPKSDPRKIVLARTQYILDQQDLPESEQTLPPYHILYSNSECLAVWCKTGKFSTLQAAVFLHSTAVGNAKSTFLMTGAVVATQPWLIPVVGIYGAVAVGMPYFILKKCKENWSKSELKLTDGFWSTADPEVYVTAIENWSGLDPSKKDMNDSDLKLPSE